MADAKEAPLEAEATSGHPAAAAIGVSKRFGATKALDDVTITVAAGESRALVGRNGAGKSTLVGILTGMVVPDSGEVRVDGKPAPPQHARGEWQRRVACVYQRPTVVPYLTVADNLFLNNYPPRRAGLIDWKGTLRAAHQALEEWGIDVNPQTPAQALAMEERQLVEIVRALSQGSRFVILDEPTAQLDARAADRLFDHIRRLRQSGVTFLYISHHLPEIFDVCDSVTVLANGRETLTSALERLTREDVVTAMVGETASRSQRRARRLNSQDGTEATLRIEKVELEGGIGPVSFAVHPGECVGLASQRQSGGLEIGRALVGLNKILAGEVWLRGERATVRAPAGAAARGIGYVPEDRHESGFIAGMTVADNGTMTALRKLVRYGFIRVRDQRALTRSLIDRLTIVASEDDLLDELSGGNQQKVVMARALATAPSLLILLHPTAGIDVAAKEALFEAIDDVLNDGAGVVLISDELEELRRCDRLLVLFKGEIVAEHSRDWRDDAVIAEMEGA